LPAYGLKNVRLSGQSHYETITCVDELYRKVVSAK